MSSRAAIFKRASIVGMLMVGVCLFAEEKTGAFAENPFQIPGTNSFSTNASGKGRQLRRPEDRPREFGVFSPLNTPAPRSFDSGAVSPMAPFIAPRPAPAPEKENTDSKSKGWIFATPDDFSADKIFKVNGFGAKDSGKEKKEQSGFEKFIAGDDKKDDITGRGKRDSLGSNKANEKNDSRSQDNSRPSDFSSREYNSRNQTDRPGAFENRANDSVSTRSSIFGEFFHGDRMAEDRWMQQSAERRNEFQQLFEPRTSTDLTKSLATANPTTVVAPSDFNRSAATAVSDPWKTDLKQFSGPRSSFDDPTSRQFGTGSASSFSTPSGAKPLYQPAVLPFPKRPGELFK